ncbi:MAG: hypothetical protein IPP19_16440 [Verrucomicrobia bacterium]|nr:hypothetical protein [Verrucomicrobiota bacterium]
MTGDGSIVARLCLAISPTRGVGLVMCEIAQPSPKAVGEIYDFNGCPSAPHVFAFNGE